MLYFHIGRKNFYPKIMLLITSVVPAYHFIEKNGILVV